MIALAWMHAERNMAFKSLTYIYSRNRPIDFNSFISKFSALYATGHVSGDCDVVSRLIRLNFSVENITEICVKYPEMCTVVDINNRTPLYNCYLFASYTLSKILIANGAYASPAIRNICISACSRYGILRHSMRYNSAKILTLIIKCNPPIWQYYHEHGIMTYPEIGIELWRLGIKNITVANCGVYLTVKLCDCSSKMHTLTDLCRLAIRKSLPQNVSPNQNKANINRLTLPEYLRPKQNKTDIDRSSLPIDIKKFIYKY